MAAYTFMSIYMYIICSYLYRYISMYIYAAVSNRKKMKSEAQVIFLNPFTVCS